MTPLPPSAQAAPSPPWARRLVEQLQLVSEIAETLTYRVLELEERLAEGERQLAELRDRAQQSSELPAVMETWLEEADERLVRVEELLRRGDTPGAGPPGGTARPLRAVAPAITRSAGGSATEVSGDDPDPFPDEVEQDFLDEQSA